MSIGKTFVGVVCAGLLAACGTGQSAHPPDISKLFGVKSSFGPEYRVTTKGPTDIDPKMLVPPKLPPGMTFTPPQCADLVTAQRLPPGIKGKMTTLSADGSGNRFVATAIQITQQAPFNTDLPKDCPHVTFTSSKLSGDIDVVDAPAINDAKTSGTHRSFQAQVRKKERSGELYHFAAYLGDYVVMVDATPLPARGQPPPLIDDARARQLLTDSVAAIRS